MRIQTKSVVDLKKLFRGEIYEQTSPEGVTEQEGTSRYLIENCLIKILTNFTNQLFRSKDIFLVFLGSRQKKCVATVHSF